MWLGQAPKVAYREHRCHADFRWWYEYSGGKLTDWGAHHVDIGQWAIGMENSGPNTIEVVKGVLPVEFKGGYPAVDDRYNTATEFLVPRQVRQRRRHGYPPRPGERREIRGHATARSSSPATGSTWTAARSTRSTRTRCPSRS